MTIKNTLKVKIAFFLALLWSLSILFLSLANLSGVNIIKLESSDKLYHGMSYLILTFLWSAFLMFKTKNLKISHKTILGLIIIVFGIIIEYLQMYITTYRSFDWWDVLANIFGVIIGLLFFSLAQKLFN